MATTASSTRAHTTHEHDFPFTRGARIGLLALLLLTVLFAAGVLFIKFQLESFRADVANGLEERFGARLKMGAISVNGLRGLRIDDLRVDFPFSQGPILSIDTDSAYININLNDLLYGKITVDRIVLDRSDIVLERPPAAQWYAADDISIDELLPFEVSRSEPFRITGDDCRFHVRNIVGDTGLDIDAFSFDVARLVDASDLTAILHGQLSGDPRKEVRVKLSLASIEDFDLQIKTDLITAEDVNVILPADQHFVLQGDVHPTLWINGRPNKTILVSVQAPFEDIVIRDHPEFLDPATGTLTLLATYSTDTNRLAVTMAKAESTQLNGNVEGSISFAHDYPEFDLRLVANRIPIGRILDYAFPGELEDMGTMDLVLDEPHELEVALSGSTQDPVFHGETRAASGHFSFVPRDKDLPPVDLTLRQIEGAWDSYSQELGLSFDIAGGAVAYEPWGLRADDLQGRVVLNDDVLTLAPFTAVCKGNNLVGDAEYHLETGDARVKFEGTVPDIEDTVFADAIHNTRLAGAVKLKGEARKQGDTIAVDADVDATQTAIAFDWWFEKPVGLAASGTIHGTIESNESAHLSALGDVASSSLSAEAVFKRDASQDNRWKVMTVDATSDHIDVNTAVKCAKIPYRVTGGTGTLGYFTFRRDQDNPEIGHQTMGCYVDDIALLSSDEDAETPIVGKKAAVEVRLTSHDGDDRPETGYGWLNADQLSLPAFGSPWLVPLKPPPGWPDKKRRWTFDLTADNVNVPPWQGREFEATAYASPEASGLSSYTAQIGEGTVEGTYNANREDNSYVTEINWTNVPAHFFLEHLKFPNVLEGTMTGQVSYSLDRDDPNTLSGSGHFDVRDGRFSADFLYELLERRAGEEMSALPPKLDFDELHAEVEFVKDTVKTPTLNLRSEGIRIDGTGQYVRDGDMDYRLKVAVAPDTAARIPILADNFNIQGHRLSGSDIDLTFHVGGPTFNPTGQVAELPPASVTLVSGALEVTREAVSLIDFPRKILVDLLKIGGGIVGGGGGGSNTNTAGEH